MLILTRRPSESVTMRTANNEEIVVTVLGIKGNQVRLGFDASKSVTINREEIQRRIDAEAATATKQK